MSTKAAAGARAAVATPGLDRGSRQARILYDDLMALEPTMRRSIFAGLDQRDIDAALRVAKSVSGTEYGLWVDDPVGFVEDVLGETMWSKQRAVLTAVARSKRVAVPSAFGTSKTHTAARATLWRMCVYPFGTSLTVTTATRFRQVQRQLWPHIRSVARAAELPIDVDTTQAHGFNRDGTRVPIGYGFSAPPHDEAAVQGIHAPRLFIVVDEAGGIARTIGVAMRGLLTGSDTRMLAIGNPATDDENTWFEELCNSDDVEVVRISAYDAPEQSGEWSPPCKVHPDLPDHTVGSHLVDGAWIRDAIADHGADSNFVKAKVLALFPKGGKSKAIPGDWVDLCYESPEPSGDDYVSLSDIVPSETGDHVVKRGAWVRLGVDVAAGGGDEFVIARAVGDLITVEHTSSGAENTNSVDVSGKILEQIKAADLLRKALGTDARVRVKVDAIGVGWGVASTLQAWRDEGIHDAEIVPVVVSEDTYREDDASTMRPYRKRDELWLTGRALMQPRRESGRGALRLRVDKRTAAQLSAPMYGTNSGGRTVIESKDHMRTRGLKSPDRAEALLLAIFEPVLKPRKPESTVRVIV